MEILEYFGLSDAKQRPIASRSILGFCEKHKNGFEYIYSPNIVSRICKRLCDRGLMECIRSYGGLGLKDNYIFNNSDNKLFTLFKENIRYYFNSVVYGFDYIYGLYRNIVVPLVGQLSNGDYTVGTGFKYLNGIVTAKHCVIDVNNLQIKGYNPDELDGKPIYISEDEGVDIAFIETATEDVQCVLPGEGKIMDEVLVMGYPKIPAFTSFLTAEKGTISSKASARLTPTVGNIAAFGMEYLTRMEAMLITAKVRGGNSGGPVINQNGCVVGVACQLPDCSKENGDYDDLGYGIAVPMRYVNDIISKKANQYEPPSDFFKAFIE